MSKCSYHGATDRSYLAKVYFWLVSCCCCCCCCYSYYYFTTSSSMPMWSALGDVLLRRSDRTPRTSRRSSLDPGVFHPQRPEWHWGHLLRPLPVAGQAAGQHADRARGHDPGALLQRAEGWEHAGLGKTGLHRSGASPQEKLRGIRKADGELHLRRHE